MLHSPRPMVKLPKSVNSALIHIVVTYCNDAHIHLLSLYNIYNLGRNKFKIYLDCDEVIESMSTIYA